MGQKVWQNILRQFHNKLYSIPRIPQVSCSPWYILWLTGARGQPGHLRHGGRGGGHGPENQASGGPHHYHHKDQGNNYFLSLDRGDVQKGEDGLRNLSTEHIRWQKNRQPDMIIISFYWLLWTLCHSLLHAYRCHQECVIVNNYFAHCNF